MNVQIIEVPYDSGHRCARMGKGPGHFIENGLVEILRGGGHEVKIARIESEVAFPTETGIAFDVNRLLAESVKSAVSEGRFPVVLAGNCNTCVGTIAGIGAERLGIIWFDAHGDFNTPETTATGFLDGMGLAMAGGRCWTSLLGTIPGFRPVHESRTIHIGSRDLDPAEREKFEEACIPLVKMKPGNETDFFAELNAALAERRCRLDRAYLHIDMDVLATDEGKPNELAPPGGLPVRVVEKAVAIIKKSFRLAACAISAYDPDYDVNECVLRAGLRIIDAVLSGNTAGSLIRS